MAVNGTFQTPLQTTVLMLGSQVVPLPGIVLNIFILFLSFRRNLIKGTYKYFVCHLALCDLMLCLILFALHPIVIMGRPEMYASWLCEVITFEVQHYCCSMIYAIALVATNRYVAICRAQLYKKVYTASNIMFICLGAHVVSITFLLPFLLDRRDLKAEHPLWCSIVTYQSPKRMATTFLQGGTCMMAQMVTVACTIRINRRLKKKLRLVRSGKQQSCINENIALMRALSIQTAMSLACNMPVIIYAMLKAGIGYFNWWIDVLSHVCMWANPTMDALTTLFVARPYYRVTRNLIINLKRGRFVLQDTVAHPETNRLDDRPTTTSISRTHLSVSYVPQCRNSATGKRGSHDSPLTATKTLRRQKSGSLISLQHQPKVETIFELFSLIFAEFYSRAKMYGRGPFLIPPTHRPELIPQIKWAQTEELILITVVVDNLKITDDLITVVGDIFSLEGKNDFHRYACKIEFYGAVEEDDWRIVHSSDPRSLEVEIKKKDKTWWPRLTVQQTDSAWIRADLSKWNFEHDKKAEAEKPVQHPEIQYAQDDDVVWLTVAENVKQEELLHIEDQAFRFKGVDVEGRAKACDLTLYEQVDSSQAKRLVGRYVTYELPKKRRGKPWWPRLLKDFKDYTVPWVHKDYTRWEAD